MWFCRLAPNAFTSNTVQPKKRRKDRILYTFRRSTTLSGQPEVAKPYLLELVNQKGWRHPISGETVELKLRTLQRWYQTAKKASNAMHALMPATRKDKGKCTALSESTLAITHSLYDEFPFWSWKLLHDNIAAALRIEIVTSYIPSYSTFRRYLIIHQMRPIPRGDKRSQEAILRKKREGSFLFEVDHVGALWHTDYHHGSFQVVTSSGSMKTPLAAAFIDDRARFICHIQWYLDETCENLTHTFIQAIMRRGLPRADVSDNGSPMIAGEFLAGGENLGLAMQRIKPRSPWMNGKIETFWGPLEGRLMSMLHNVRNLTLAELNTLTQVWVEQEYHRSVHSELKATPLSVFMNHKSVLREPPTLDELKKAFRISITRRQRMTDHTITVDGVRYQVPSLYWNQIEMKIAYARWDLSSVDLLNDETGRPIATLRPVDKLRNANMHHREILSIRENIESVLPPLLREQYLKSKTAGEKAIYMPKDEHQ